MITKCCDKWTHVRCSAKVSLNQYNRCVLTDGQINFVCDGCSFATLPFYDGNVSDGDGLAVEDLGAAAAPPASSSSQVSVNLPSTFASFPKILSDKGLHFIHANVRSLLPKLPEVHLLLSRTTATVFAASETWLDSTVNDGEIHTPGYQVVRRDRNRSGGGVALFIRDNVAFNPRPDLSVDGLEAVWIELLPPRSKSILVCAFYRPPNDGNFLGKLEQCLSKVSPRDEYYLLGDMNINFDFEKRNGNSSLLGHLKNLLSLFNCKQIVTEPTRVTPSSCSLIDHILTNSKDKVREAGVIPVGFSDHFLIYMSRGMTRPVFSDHVTKRVRSFRTYSPRIFREILTRTDWSSVLLSTDVNVCLSEFSRLFKSAVDAVAPARDIRVKQRGNPWMTSDILSRIKERDALLSLFKRDRSDVATYQKFCKIRNAVQRDIKFAKREYFRQCIERDRGDSGKLWQNLKSLGYANVSSGGGSGIVLEENGQKVFNSAEVAGIFNRFYTSVASQLVERLPSSSGLFSIFNDVFRGTHFSRMKYHKSFTLSPVSRLFIRKQLLSLSPRKAIGLDDISPRFLKDGADAIVEPVSHIVNISILTETVPSSFKSAKVIPLFKKGSKLDAGNYRPVSVLPVLSKILERAVDFQLKEFLEKNGLIFENQSGFRNGFSTNTCTIGLTDFVKEEMAAGRMVGMVMIDLQKAFDTVNHDILLEKMKAMGVTSIPWFRSYLSQRTQSVIINGIKSESMDVTCGVPQGSILGPQLFLLYINDLHVSVSSCKLALYADDSALIYSHRDAGVIANVLSFDLGICKQWLCDNKLSLHVGKTECILFGSAKRTNSAHNFHVTCEGQLVKRVQSVKYLGIHLDALMKGSVHVADVIKKCAGRISFLYRSCHLLDFFSRKMLCEALVAPYMEYCCSSWYSGIGSVYRSKLEVLQRRMIRLIYSMGPRDHVDTVQLKELNWLSIADRVRYFKLCHVFRIRHGMAPRYLSGSFVPVAQYHTHQTRDSDLNYAILKGFSKSTSGFTYTAVTDWNSLPRDIKQILSFTLFKKKLKQHLASY